MHLCDRINSGMLFYEHGHTDPIDIQQEKQLQEERDHCKEVMFEYNNTHPREDARRQSIMKNILGSCGRGRSCCHGCHIAAPSCCFPCCRAELRMACSGSAESERIKA